MLFRNNPFLVLTIGICCVILIPVLFMNGMFMDGGLYACVSKNYALGNGTFWEPTFSETNRHCFHEQPPLLFFLQGWFFKLIGFGFYTERIYSLLAAILNAWLIYRCWTTIQTEKKLGWMPILFWFTMPVIFWAFTNGVEECTMSVFVLAAMLHLLRALHLKQKESIHLVLAGIFILLAGLTKGFQGMFLLGTPFIWWLVMRQSSFLSMFRQLIFVSFPSLIFVLIAWFTPAIHNSFEAYFISRFENTFNHFHDTSDSRFHLLFELLITVPTMIGMIGIVFFLTRKKMTGLVGWNENRKMIFFFLATAATGILPLMVTLEQRGFYIATAMPYIAIAGALLISPNMSFLQENLPFRPKTSLFVSFFGVFILFTSIIATVFLWGKPKRDAEKLHDLPLIAQVTGPNITLYSSTNIDCDWSFIIYGQRFHGFSFTDKNLPELQWLLLEKNDSAPSNFKLVSLPTEHYLLYKKQP